MHDHGAFTPASAVPAPSADSSEPLELDRPVFATARRGYDSAAVDAHLDRLEEIAGALRSALAESERRRAMAEQHAVAVEDEIRAVRAGRVADAPETTGFGARAERLLRLAETEAEQIRAAARRTAAEVAQRALSDAERHRGDVRQQLVAESARAQEQAARRAAELRDREDAVRTRLDRAQAEADLIRATAQHAADAQRSAVQAEVAELRDRSAHELRRAREREQQELVRLRDLQGTARLELNRLASTIRAELTTSGPRPSPGPARGTARQTPGGPGALGEMPRPGAPPPAPPRSEMSTARHEVAVPRTLHAEVAAVATS